MLHVWVIIIHLIFLSSLQVVDFTFGGLQFFYRICLYLYLLSALPYFCDLATFIHMWFCFVELAGCLCTRELRGAAGAPLFSPPPLWDLGDWVGTHLMHIGALPHAGCMASNYNISSYSMKEPLWYQLLGADCPLGNVASPHQPRHRDVGRDPGQCLWYKYHPQLD